MIVDFTYSEIPGPHLISSKMYILRLKTSKRRFEIYILMFTPLQLTNTIY